MIGKLCEVPVQPLSRSLPVGGTVRVIWDGSPLRDGHVAWVPVLPGGTHCTRSLFLKPLSFISSTTAFDGLNFLSGLLAFFGTRLRARLMVPAMPQPAGDTGGAWKALPRRFFFAMGALKESAVSVPRSEEHTSELQSLRHL